VDKRTIDSWIYKGILKPIRITPKVCRFPIDVLSCITTIEKPDAGK